MRYKTYTWAASFSVLAGLGGTSASAQQFSDWTPATPVQEVNSPVNDGCPIEAPNGLSLFIASNRPGSMGTATPLPNDIWTASRASIDAQWGIPVNVGAPVNTEYNDLCPTPLPGGYLMFVSERPVPAPCSTGPGRGDIFITRYDRKRGWREPMHLGCVAAGNGPNSEAAEYSPSVVETEHETLLFFSSGAAGTQDIYVSRLGRNGRFGAPTMIAELSTPTSDDRMPNVSRNGLEMVFSSNRPVPGSTAPANQDVYVSRRKSINDPWSAPVNLGPNVNTAGNETRATMSWDRTRLYFGRDGNVYTSNRMKLRDSD